jgi:hypothetical protein
MAFVALYRKTTADPKEIDLPAVAIKVKTKIPDPAIKAFKTKVPAKQAKPFDFSFDYDQDAGKCQITVKKVGADFVFAWVDPTYATNKAKMKAVETDAEAWKTSGQALANNAIKYAGEVTAFAPRVAAFEKTAAAGNVLEGDMTQFEAAKVEIKAIGDRIKNAHGALQQFWNGGPKDGIAGLMKKHGIPIDEIGPERKDADADFNLLTAAIKKANDAITASAAQWQALSKRLDMVGANLYLLSNRLNDKNEQLQQAEEEIQKSIGTIQGWKNADFTDLKYNELTKEAREFGAKAGSAWDALSKDPAKIQQTVARNNQVLENMRVRAMRPANEYNRITTVRLNLK